MARIGIDARFYGPLGKGLGRYTQEITDNIVNHIDKTNKYVIFLSLENFSEFNIPEGEEDRIKKVVVKYRWYSLKEQLFFPLILLKYNLDLVHFCHFNVPILYPKRFIVTIHDLILTKFPTVRASTLSPWIYKFKNLAYRLIISSAVKRSKTIIAVSEFTKEDIIDRFKAPADKIIVTYEGVANLSKGNDSLFSLKQATKISSFIDPSYPFWLYVGNAYPHKNLEWLLDVFKSFNLRNPSSRLILVGKEDYFYLRLKNYVKSRHLENLVFFPGYVPDKDLEILYKKATAYIFPSLYEGFGLPPLEAMAKGCPVLSSDQASLPEILGDAAWYFNPKNSQELLSLMEKIYTNNNLRQELVSKGLTQVKKYSWWECAAATVKAYETIIYDNKK